MFEPDSPLMELVNKITDILILNLLTLLTCLPIVTIGASLSAMNDILYQMMENQEGKVARDYFLSFRRNFKKGTLLWLLMLVIFAILAADAQMVIANAASAPGWMVGLLLGAALVLILSAQYIFPLQAHFENTVRGTLKNSLIVMVMNLPRSLLMLLVNLTPLLAFAISYSATILLLFCGLTLPGYINCFLYRPIFRKIAGEAPAKPEEE